MAPIPTEMRALTIPKYGPPSTYDIATLHVPKITRPNELLIKVSAASINPIDVKLANGMAKLVHREDFPFKIGYDAAGTIAAVGSAVMAFQVGDAVYSRVPGIYRGTVAEYVLSTEEATARKPEKLTWVQAAAVPLAALTALQSMDRADALLPDGLKGKTVFVPAGLSGTGSFAVQLARNCFEAGEVLTTLSTGKIDKARDLLGTETFTAIDYIKTDPISEIGKGRVSYLFDTMGATLGSMGIMRKGGVIRSISMVPSGTLMKQRGDMDDVPTVMVFLLDFADWLLRTYASWRCVNYSYVFMQPSGRDLDRLSTWMQEDKIKPIVGRTARLSDVEAVRAGCREIFGGKGGIGKFVIEID